MYDKWEELKRLVNLQARSNEADAATLPNPVVANNCAIRARCYRNVLQIMENLDA